MNNIPSPPSRSGNLKPVLSRVEGSKTCGERRRTIENLKWMGIVAIGFTFAMCGAVASAQQAGKIFRIGFLDPSNASGRAVVVDVFRQELSKLGWIEGKNIAIEYRFSENKGAERLSELAADLARLSVDLIVSTGDGPTLAVKKATTIIPIVMTTSSDPVAQGFIVSLARPGGNVTGLSSLAADLNTKRLEILKDAIPKLARVALLQSPGSVTSDLQVKELRPAAVALKLKLEEIDTQPNAKGLESAFQIAKQKQLNAIMTVATRPFFAESKRIVELAGEHRMAAIYPNKEFVDAGGLMSYGVDYDDLYRKAAYYVDKILKGAKPADLPVQQATKFQFVVNLNAAKQIGLTIPVRVLERANQVIK